MVVSVGETKLTESMLRTNVPEWDSWTNQQRLNYLERWIDEETIYQEAIASAVDEDTILQRQIEETVRKMIVDHFVSSFTDTMLVGDGERMDFYHKHPELYVRGKNLYSGAIISFRDWQGADTYYKMKKKEAFMETPVANWLTKTIVTFDSVETTPDSCLIPSLADVPKGQLQPMKVCGGALKMFVITSKLDSADVLPYEEVAEDVATRTWVDHQSTVMTRLKKQWKASRPIFTQSPVFKEKDK